MSNHEFKIGDKVTTTSVYPPRGAVLEVIGVHDGYLWLAHEICRYTVPTAWCSPHEPTQESACPEDLPPGWAP